MGAGIAQVCAASGLKVVLHDVKEGAAEAAITGVGANLQRLVSKDKLQAAELPAIVGRIRVASAPNDLSGADFLIEAATENLQVKQLILKELDKLSRPEAIIATNTSSVSITKLAASLSKPDRFIRMHFFNPVPVMGLVEVIRGIRTSDSAFHATESFAKALGKTPIFVKNTPGFVVNRILIPMINEAIFAVQEGVASAEDIDGAMKLGANHPIGPLALADLIGLDTVLSIMEVFYRELRDSKYRPATLLVEMVDAGYLGRKTKKGFFTY